MIKRVSFVSIPVNDQDKALAFWTQKVGFAVATDQPMGDDEGAQRWIELRIPGADTRLVLFTADAHKDRIGTPSNISFTCDDAKKTYDELKERGVEMVGPLEQEHWGSSMRFKDPDGNLFHVSSK